MPADALALPADLPQLVAVETAESILAAYLAAARGTFAPHTERAVRADTAVFVVWCRGVGRSAGVPVDAAAFVDAMAKAKVPATARRYIASLVL